VKHLSLGGGLAFAPNDTANSLSLTASTAVPARDVTASFKVTSFAAFQDASTGHHLEVVALTNTGGNAVAGPVSLVLGDLSSDANLLNVSGTTRVVAPAGRPHINVDLRGLGSISPGQRVFAVLEFSSSTGQAITFTSAVLAGTGLR
jgi:hypothetical protein